MKINEFQKFLIEWYEKKYPNQRIGQAFLNKFYPTIIDSDIFYQENNHQAIEQIISKYINTK